MQMAMKDKKQANKKVKKTRPAAFLEGTENKQKMIKDEHGG